MALDDFKGEPVLSGTWLYGGVKAERISILARNYDYYYAMYEEADALEGEEPTPLGPDGRLYYVSASPPLPTIEEAKAWADSQPWGPVDWDE